MKTIPLITALVLLHSSLMTIARAESVETIVEKFETKKIAALNTYLEANPGAPDSGDALMHLVDANRLLGNTDAIPPLLEKRYAKIGKGPDADLSELINNTVVPLVQSYGAAGDKEKALEFIERVKTDTSANPNGPKIAQFLDLLGESLSAVATPAKGGTMDISFTDLNGEEFDLAGMKGKVVLVDFWATWCGPCVQEMPNVIDAYKKYHGDGFEVVGISLDSDKDRLLSYIKENEMPWPQYFDGKGWQNDIAGKFGIRSIPATFLIGKDGKIAATDLRGNALEATLEELLK